MSRDYKDAGSKKPAPKGKKKPAATASKPKVEKPSGGMSSGVALFLGLSIGLGVAGLVYFKLKPTETAKSAAPVVEVKPATKAKPEVKEEEESKFDFYSILPKLEVIIPDQEIQSERKGDSKSSHGEEKKQLAPIDKPGSYILQAGSFRNASDADRVKAELALLGVQPHIETVTINGSDTWHRVRVGPFSDTKQLNKIRNRLLDNGIDVMVLRVKS